MIHHLAKNCNSLTHPLNVGGCMIHHLAKNCNSLTHPLNVGGCMIHHLAKNCNSLTHPLNVGGCMIHHLAKNCNSLTHPLNVGGCMSSSYKRPHSMGGSVLNLQMPGPAWPTRTDGFGMGEPCAVCTDDTTRSTAILKIGPSPAPCYRYTAQVGRVPISGEIYLYAINLERTCPDRIRLDSSYPMTCLIGC
jgi:hypothetical protein